MSQRFEGRNLEEALDAAAAALAVERWQLTYHVLVQKRGFLGGVKRIVVEAEVNGAAAPPPVAAPPYQPRAAEPSQARAPETDRPPRASRAAGDRGGRDRGGRDRGGRERGGRDRGGRGPERPRQGGRQDEGEVRKRVPIETILASLPEQGPRSEAARSVVQWIETVIELADLDLILRTEENDEQIVVRLYGIDADRLTDRNGELLDAVQVLANKALVGRKVEKEIELDCDAFKEKRVEDLQARARAVAERVRSGGREELLPAMTPIERRIVHLALRDDEVVTTESRGEGFYKRVAILPRSQAAPPDAGSSPAEP